MVNPPVAILLRCPECGHDLPGLDADRAWCCAPCGRAWEIERGALAPRTFVAWRVATEGPVTWLPFWRIGYEPWIECSDARVREAIEHATGSRRAWVRAFRMDNAFVIGDPGQALTAADVQETFDATDLPECVGARIGSEDAYRLAELFVLASADRIADVTPATLSLVPKDVALVAVPYIDHGPRLVCAVDGRELRRSALPDL